VVGGLTFALLGISGVIFWGVTMGVFALIPLLGKVVVAPVLLWLLVTGQVTRAIILAVIGFGVIFALDNFARPFLAGGRAQMSTLTMFISVLGGISVFGILGLVLGPIVVAMATSVLDVYTEATGTAPAVRASAPAPDSA
jgi:predicted PurR-regulated permease PerM